VQSLPIIPRDEFLARWNYQAGEHLTILAPTRWGKTHLSYQLLQAASSPRLPAIVFVMKPRDETVTDFIRSSGYVRTTTWPPRRQLWPWSTKPAGYTLWPRQSMDLADEGDDEEMARAFLRAMNYAYRRGRHILFADEIAGIVNELSIGGRPVFKRATVKLWSRGAGLRTGLWAASQRPVEIPRHAYSQAEHIFLGNDPDVQARKRLSEIGGVDPRTIQQILPQLRRYQWLYIRRSAGQRGFRVIGA
jgi:hypothetical protein